MACTKKNNLLIAIAILLASSAAAWAITKTPAKDITAEATTWSGNLSTSDDTVQKALQTLNDMTVAEMGVNWGDVTGLQTELNLKVDKTTTVNGHPLDANVTVSASDVGLGNVDNTSDLDKPISTATQTALNGKEPTLTKGNASAGTGIGVAGGTGAVIGSGVTITNTAPDQTVSFAGGTNITIGGTYPAFTIMDNTQVSGPYLTSVNWSDGTTTNMTGINWDDFIRVGQDPFTAWDKDYNDLTNKPDLTQYLTSVNWDEMPLLAQAGINWDDIKLNASGVNWPDTFGLGTMALANTGDYQIAGAYLTASALTPYALLSGASFTGDISTDTNLTVDGEIYGTGATFTGTVTAGGFSSTGNKILTQIYSTTLTEAATSVAISGLDGNTDEQYIINMEIVNGYNGSSTFGFLLNGDTGANYGYGGMYGTGSTAAYTSSVNLTRAVTRTISAKDYIGTAGFLLFAKSGIVRVAMSTGDTSYNITGETVTGGGFYTDVWNNTADNITSITFVAGSASGLGVGTKISISTWK